MRLDIVTPEKQLLSEEVTQVQLPGMEGDMTILGDHAPLITTLRPGIVVVDGDSGQQEFLVTGGFAEISAAGTSILAEQAVLKADMTKEMLDAALAEAREALENATAETRAAAAMRVNDIDGLLIRHGTAA